MTLGYGVRDVALECIVLSHYGNFGKLGSYAYFHTSVIDNAYALRKRETRVKPRRKDE